MADANSGASLMPRLSTKHFLLCVAVCAVLLGGGDSAAIVDASPFRVFSFIVTGCALTAAIVIINVCRATHVWKSTDPGHWFALVSLWEFLESALVSKFLYYATGAVDARNVLQGPIETKALINSIAFIGIAAILIVGICITRWPVYWRIAVGIHFLDAINAAIWRLSTASDYLHFAHMPDAIYRKSLPVFGVLTIAFLVVAIVIDVSKKQFRNWPHWTGLLYEFVHWFWVVRAYG